MVLGEKVVLDSRSRTGYLFPILRRSFDGLTMQTSAKLLVYVVLAALLLSWVSGPPLPRARDHRGRQRHRVLVRLRRCRGNNPAHHPVRPCKNAVLPPDDDDDDIDPARPHAKAALERLPSLYDDPAFRSFSLRFGSRPLPTEIPRHQTLCILLI